MDQWIWIVATVLYVLVICGSLFLTLWFGRRGPPRDRDDLNRIVALGDYRRPDQ